VSRPLVFHFRFRLVSFAPISAASVNLERSEKWKPAKVQVRELVIGALVTATVGAHTPLIPFEGKLASN